MTAVAAHPLHATRVTKATVEVVAAQCSCGWRGEPTVDRATAEQDAAIHAHTIKFTGRGRYWLCSCHAWGYSDASAEVHAHAKSGRIEMGGRS